MSRWFDTAKEDMSISDDGKTIQIHVTNDDQGSIWADVKISDIKEILKNHEAPEHN